MVDFGAPLQAVESGTPEPTGTQAAQGRMRVQML
jgi:hypothetical protein